MGWLIFFVLVLIAAVVLWRIGKFDRDTGLIAAATFFMAATGYLWQGSPGQAGVNKEAVETEQSVGELAPDQLRRSFASSMNSEGQWIALSDALLQAGRTRAAVSILTEGTKKAPQNPDVWVALGNALFVHGGNQMNPAAQYAFSKATQLRPDHPAPDFFRGMGFAQRGDLDAAEEIWQALLNRAPKDADWRADIEARLARIAQLRQQSGGQAMPAPQTAN